MNYVIWEGADEWPWYIALPFTFKVVLIDSLFLDREYGSAIFEHATPLDDGVQSSYDF